MDRNLEYVFSPLNSVDLKSLQKVAEAMKNSRKKPEKAIGVFLARVASWRAGEISGSGSSSDSGTSKTISSESTSHIQKNSGLRDLY